MEQPRRVHYVTEVQLADVWVAGLFQANCAAIDTHRLASANMDLSFSM
jgi:hypothetical protein